MLFETPDDQGNDTGHTCKASHGIANSKGHENSWRAGWLKRRHESEQAETSDRQQGQCSDDGDDDSHGPRKCKRSVVSEIGPSIGPVFQHTAICDL